MLTKRIIPCLDVDQGRVVKGVSFVNLRDAGDPAELASFYDREGADELVFLDITASSDARKTIIEVVKNVSERVFIPLTVGGGIRKVEDVREMLEAGADKVSLNTAAVENPRLVKEASTFFGNQCIVAAIDAKRVTANNLVPNFPKGDLALASHSQWEIYTHGGRIPTGIDVIEWAKRVTELGAGELLVTSMDEDGQQSGYDLELLGTISDCVSVPVIASGGAGTLEHLYEGLTVGRADAVLAASIFHFGTYRVKQAKEYLAKLGIPMRLVTEQKE